MGVRCIAMIAKRTYEGERGLRVRTKTCSMPVSRITNHSLVLDLVLHKACDNFYIHSYAIRKKQPHAFMLAIIADMSTEACSL